MIPSFLRPEVLFASLEIVTAPVVAPARQQDVTSALARVACVCGVPCGRHFDGWDGTRLDCAEAQRRAGVMPAAPLDDPDPFGPAPTEMVQSPIGDTLAGYTTNRGRWTRRADGRAVRLDLPAPRRPR